MRFTRTSILMTVALFAGLFAAGSSADAQSCNDGHLICNVASPTTQQLKDSGNYLYNNRAY